MDFWSDWRTTELYQYDQILCFANNTVHHHKHIKATMKHGHGSVRLWGCFSAAGPGRLVKLEKYHQILEDNLIQSARRLQLGRFIFQQGNNPKHTTELVQKQQANCLGIAESKSRCQSSQKFVAGLEKTRSFLIPLKQGRMDKNYSVQMCQPD